MKKGVVYKIRTMDEWAIKRKNKIAVFLKTNEKRNC